MYVSHQMQDCASRLNVVACIGLLVRLFVVLITASVGKADCVVLSTFCVLGRPMCLPIMILNINSVGHMVAMCCVVALSYFK